MTPYDQTTKILAESALILLQVLYPKLEISEIEPIPTDFQEIIIRKADLLYRVILNRQRELLHLEMQSYADPDLSVRMLMYLCLIFLKYRMWAIQYVIHLKRHRGNFLTRLTTRFMSFSYHNIYLGGLDASKFVDNVNLGVVV